MKKAIFFMLILSIAPSTYATVTTRVCLADGNTPLELADPCIPFVYRPIMAGTHLTIIINSDTADYWDGELSLWDANQDYGCLYGRNYNEETFDWEGSRFPAAGEMAMVWDFAGFELVDEQWYEARGFQFSTDVETVTDGDWFIVDYNAISAGPCSVVFYDNSFERPLYQIFFTQVRTSDFDDDGIVSFKDLALLGLNWQRTDCLVPEDCSGTDLDEDGKVGFNDLELFADFWLETTR